MISSVFIFYLNLTKNHKILCDRGEALVWYQVFHFLLKYWKKPKFFKKLSNILRFFLDTKIHVMLGSWDGG